MACYPSQQGMHSRTGIWVREALVMGLGLLALGLVSGSLGDLSPALNGTLAVGALLGVALVLPLRIDSVCPSQRTQIRRMVAAVAIAAVSLPLVARGDPLGIPGAALFFLALSLSTSAESSGILSALLLTSLLFALYRTFVASLPGLWYLEQWVSTSFSRTAGVGLAVGPLRLGPTALGVPLFLLFALYALSVALLSPVQDEVASVGRKVGPSFPSPVGRSRSGWRTALSLGAWLVMLVLAMATFLWLQPLVGAWLADQWPVPATAYASSTSVPMATYLESLLLLFLLLWLASLPAGLALHSGTLPLAAPRKRGLVAAAGLGLLALAMGVLTLDPPLHPQRGTILFFDAGQLEWGRPVFGKYGPQSGGTFGLWPDYLAAYGYRARTGRLNDVNLRGVQAVVLINQPAALKAEEQEQLLAFVADGGGLVVWAEHTEKGGFRESVNALLSRLAGHRGTPIQVRFDSAVPTRQGWAEGLSLRPHPALAGLRDAVDLVIAVGASLDIRPPAEPIIIGRFGHSDDGDATNRAQNYVGDMRYGPSERLGDAVLAAGMNYGRGRIVVLGDTTPLGSVNLMTSMPFHARLLDWVTAQPATGWDLVFGNRWLAVVLLVGAVACLALARSRLTVAGAALVLGVVLATTGWVNVVRNAPPLPDGPIAYVDVSHLERFDRMLWEETSIGGLDYNLVRNGLLPLLLRGIDSTVLGQAELLVLIAPGQSFSSQEIATIRGWVEEGGRLLLSVGFEESEASQMLLTALGLSVEAIPLGPAEAQLPFGLVRFHEAWPVSAADAIGETIVSAYGYPLALYRPLGKGGVVLIGDSSFLLGGTLEGQDVVQEGNILLLRELLRTYLRLGGE